MIAISGHPDEMRALEVYTPEDVLGALSERLDKNDQILGEKTLFPATFVTELALEYTVMEKLGHATAKYVNITSGSTSAVLVEEANWEESSATLDLASHHGALSSAAF